MSDPAVGREHVDGLSRVADKTVYPHVFENADREVGGMLIGLVPPTGGLPLITGAIEAVGADEQRAALTFTQKTWEHVHRTLDGLFPPDEQIIGWYHSHPGFGIFLSEHDLFIHRSFFNGPSQIALVVDPHARTEGVFVWEHGDIQQLYEQHTPPRWEPIRPFVPALEPEPVASAPPPTLVAAPAEPAPAPASPARYPLLALVLAGALGLATGWAAERVLEGSGAPAPARTTEVISRPKLTPVPATAAPATAQTPDDPSMTVPGVSTPEQQLERRTP